jgi:hypothetical protein
MVNGPEDLFPGLRGTAFQIAGPPDPNYNCIAWAAGLTTAWWWPIGDPQRIYWPAGVLHDETLEAVRSAFAVLGYVDCENADLEPGHEKVAIFANDEDFPTHAARQLASGRWTSKLGQLECNEHALRDLEGKEYGSVKLLMRRPFPGA